MATGNRNHGSVQIHSSIPAVGLRLPDQNGGGHQGSRLQTASTPNQPGAALPATTLAIQRKTPDQRASAQNRIDHSHHPNTHQPADGAVYNGLDIFPYQHEIPN